MRPGGENVCLFFETIGADAAYVINLCCRRRSFVVLAKRSTVRRINWSADVGSEISSRLDIQDRTLLDQTARNQTLPERPFLRYVHSRFRALDLTGPVYFIFIYRDGEEKRH